MNGLMIALVILGVLLIGAFSAWLYLVNQRTATKAEVLLCDSLLIMLSAAVLMVGLQFRSQKLEEERNNRKMEQLEQIESEGMNNSKEVSEE